MRKFSRQPVRIQVSLSASTAIRWSVPRRTHEERNCLRDHTRAAHQASLASFSRPSPPRSSPCPPPPPPAARQARQGPRRRAVLRPAQDAAEGPRKADLAAPRNRGLTAIEGAASNTARALHVEDDPGQDDRRLRLGQRAPRQAAEGRLAGDLVGPRHHRRLPTPARPPGRWRPLPSRPTSPTSSPILESFVESGYAVVRSDYEGLGTPGPHPYLASNPGGPERRRHRLRRPPARPRPEQALRARRALPGRPRRARGSRPGEALGAGPEARAEPSPTRPPPT